MTYRPIKEIGSSELSPGTLEQADEAMRHWNRKLLFRRFFQAKKKSHVECGTGYAFFTLSFDKSIFDTLSWPANPQHLFIAYYFRMQMNFSAERSKESGFTESGLYQRL